jgi:hypothetical protein
MLNGMLFGKPRLLQTRRFSVITRVTVLLMGEQKEPKIIISVTQATKCVYIAEQATFMVIYIISYIA